MSLLKSKYQYKIYKGLYTIEETEYIGYGISIIDTESCRELMCIEDITTSKEKILSLIEKCNSLQLSPVHIYDVIEDFLQ